MLNTVEMQISKGVEGVDQMLRKGGVKCVVGVSGWPGLVGYTPVYSDDEDAAAKKEKDKVEKAKREPKKQPGIVTLTLSNPSVYTILSAFSPFSTFSKPQPRNTLRSDLYTRSLCHPIQQKIAQLKRNRRLGIAVAVLALAGYYGKWEWVRRMMGRETWEEVVIRRRGEWLRELRRGGQRWIGV